MALFFNVEWFAARLKALALTPDIVAQTLGLSRTEWEAVTRDQRELKHKDVVRLAGLLGVSAAVIEREAGIGTERNPARDKTGISLVQLEQRVTALEQRLGGSKPKKTD